MLKLKHVLRALFLLSALGVGYFDLPLGLFFVGLVVLVIIYERADSIIELSFGPLRAKLERNVSESEKLLSGLRSLALAQSRAVVAAASHTGRFATQDGWIFVAAKEIENGLRAIGASDDELRASRADLVRLTLRDLGAAATNGSDLPSDLGQEAISEWRLFRGGEQLSDPEFIEQWLSRHNVLGPEQKEQLEAMRWIIKNNDIRDETQFLLSKRENRLTIQRESP